MKFWTVRISYGFIVEIMMHIIAEFLTVVALILGSVELIRRKPWAMGIHRVSLGMLIYTAIASSGYFMDHGEIPPVVMFLVILIITSILLILTFRKERSREE